MHPAAVRHLTREMMGHPDRLWGSPILFWYIVLSSPEEKLRLSTESRGSVLAKGWMQGTLHTEPEVGLRVGSAEKNGDCGERKWPHNLVQQPPKGSVH